jgi:hypothetical protein
LQKVKKKLQATLEEYIRATRCRSLSPPKEGFCDALLNLAGETPVRQLLATLLAMGLSTAESNQVIGALLKNAETTGVSTPLVRSLEQLLINY